MVPVWGCEMDLLLRLHPDVTMPLYQQLIAALREAIVGGHLAPGMRLPSSRDLAATHKLARNTVVAAYQHLTMEGYLEVRERSGYYVSQELPDAALQAARVQVETGEVTPAIRLSSWAQAMMTMEGPASADRLPFDFRQSFPGHGGFPYQEWREHLIRSLEMASPRMLDYGDDPAGYQPLREAIADYAARSRGVVCDPDQVVITTGTRQSTDLLIRTVLNPGDAVGMEEPGYPGARQCLTAFGAQVVPIPVDERGMRVDSLEQAGPLRLVYVTPSNQYPTGVTLDLSRRLSLLDWAWRTGALVVEDDYDGEFRYEGRPLQSLQGLDKGRRVIYLGTFAKSIAPALRLGYLIVPKPLIAPMTRGKWLADRETAFLPQAALASFINESGLERHLRRLRPLFKRRRDAFLAALSRYLPTAQYGEVCAGMHLMITLREVRNLADETNLIKQACKEGIGLQSARACFVEPPASGRFLFWFSHLEESRMQEGIQRLARLLYGGAFHASAGGSLMRNGTS